MGRHAGHFSGESSRDARNGRCGGSRAPGGRAPCAPPGPPLADARAPRRAPVRGRRRRRHRGLPGRFGGPLPPGRRRRGRLGGAAVRARRTCPRRVARTRLRRARRAALRIPCPRSLGPRGGPAAQRRQVAARPLRARNRRTPRPAPRGLRAQGRRRSQPLSGRVDARRRGLGPVRAPQRGAGGAPVERGTPPARALERDRGLRGPRARPHQVAPRDPGGPARHLRRPRAPGADRPPALARRHHARTAPDPGDRERAVPPQARPDQLLGLQHPRLLRPGTVLRHPQRAGAWAGSGPGRGQGHGEPPPRGRHRSDPRRRLQPHRGGGWRRPPPVLARPRQHGLLPARRAQPRHLRRPHGLREHARLPPQPGGPDDAGQPAVLGGARGRGRLPLRPRRHARS